MIIVLEIKKATRRHRQGLIWSGIPVCLCVPVLISNVYYVLIAQVLCRNAAVIMSL